jgi:hypothetical protein
MESGGSSLFPTRGVGDAGALENRGPIHSGGSRGWVEHNAMRAGPLPHDSGFKNLNPVDDLASSELIRFRERLENPCLILNAALSSGLSGDDGADREDRSNGFGGCHEDGLREGPMKRGPVKAEMKWRR